MEQNNYPVRVPRGEFRRWESDWSLSTGAGRESSLTWEQVVRILRKHRWFLIATIGCLTLSITAAALMMRNVYQPTARLEIDPPGGGIKTLHEIESPSSETDADYLETQLQILQSDGMAMRVIRTRRLDQNLEFISKSDLASTGTPSKEAPENSSNPGEASFLQERLDLADPTPVEATALQAFHKNLSVNPIRNSRLVEVSFASHDPSLSQAVTNTLVTQFIDQDYRNRYVTTMEASEWLSAQLNDLREKVSEANRAVTDYQKKYGLVESDERDAPLSQLMAEVSRQLSDAQADRIQAEAFVRTIDLGQAETIPAVRDDVVYQNLLTRYADVRAQLAQARTIYGDENGNVKKLQSEATELVAQADAERTQLISRVRTSFAAARAREQMMTESMGKLQAQMGDTSSHLVEYRMLKNEAAAKAELYNTLQARLKEAGIYAGLKSGNIRVVDMAPRLHEASSPHRKLIIAIGATLSTIFALALVFIRESFDNTVRIPDDIRDWIRLPSLAVLPAINEKTPGKGRDLPRANGSGLNVLPDGKTVYPKVFWFKPQTAEAEAIRALRTALMIPAPGSVPPRVILVSSASAGEGKTTVAVNLASVLAQQGKACLIEGDLRCPMIEAALGLRPRSGLAEVLSGTAAVSDALIPATGVPGLTVFPVKSVPDSPADLLASEQMRTVISSIREQFDYVVIDSPPIIIFPDAQTLASHVDAVILVSRYCHTTRRAMTRGAELLAEVQAPVIGVVLNDMDLASADYHYFNYGYSWAMSGRKYDYAKKRILANVDENQGTGPEKSRGAHA